MDGKDIDLAERVRLKKADRNELYSLHPPFPVSNFLMELSNLCNHACIFCAHQKMQRKPRKIDKALAFSILRQAYDLGTREVGFYATGEPFLNPELPEYIAEAKRIGYTYVYLTSNGSLATPEKVDAIINAGLDSLKFSINAPSRKLYAFIHGHDHFDRVVEHLRYVHEMREKSGKTFKLYVTGILTRFTEGLQWKWHELFDGLCDQVVFKHVYNQSGYMPEIEEYLRCDCDKEVTRRCNLPFDAISVTQEGYLSIENADYENMLVVADLNTTSLKDAWYGETMTNMRRRFMEDKLEGTLCDGCVHHTHSPARAILPEYSSVQGEYDFDDSLVRNRVEHSDLTVYVPMSADIVHPGHINIIQTARRYGKVIVGLFTDEAIASYKKQPLMSYEQRKIVVSNIKGVSEVIPQHTRDYDENISKLKPDFLIHGKDWQTGPLSSFREKSIATMAEWDGQVIEPDYTEGVSSSDIKRHAAAVWK